MAASIKGELISKNNMVKQMAAIIFALISGLVTMTNIIPYISCYFHAQVTFYITQQVSM